MPEMQTIRICRQDPYECAEVPAGEYDTMTMFGQPSAQGGMGEFVIAFMLFPFLIFALFVLWYLD